MFRLGAAGPRPVTKALRFVDVMPTHTAVYRGQPVNGWLVRERGRRRARYFQAIGMEGYQLLTANLVAIRRLPIGRKRRK
jgi:hypothetical protein